MLFVIIILTVGFVFGTPDDVVASTISTSASQTIDSDHWCYEYDEIRFKIDASNIAINTAEGHVLFLTDLITTTLWYVNENLRKESHSALKLDQIGHLAKAGRNMPSHLWAPARRILGDIENFSLQKKEQLIHQFHEIVDSNENLTNLQKAVIFARLTIGIEKLRRKNYLDLEMQKGIRNKSLKDIFDNREYIRNCLADRMADATEALVRLEEVQKYNLLVSKKFEIVREVIADAVDDNSSLPGIPGLKIRCLQSVRSVIFERKISPQILRDLPTILKGEMKLKNWDFLVVWLQALDDLYQHQRQAMSEIDKRIVFHLNTKSVSLGTINSLAQDIVYAQELIASDD